MNSFCHYYNFSQCQSCEWILKPYAKQIQLKENILKEKLSFLSVPTLERTETSPEIAFRNRAKITVTGSLENPILGIPGEAGDLDNGQDLLECPIHHPSINEVLKILPYYIKKFRLTPYRIKEKKGELKGLILFYSASTDQMYLRFILRSKECFFRIKKFTAELLLKCPYLKCISVNIQPIAHALLEGPQELYLTEKSSIEHKINGISFQISPQAFIQTNSIAADSLYTIATSWIAEVKPKRMLELYCGSGVFSILSAHSSQNTLGIEINKQAVSYAQKTALLNKFSNIHFLETDATLALNQTKDFNPDLILVNPPRAGLKESIRIIKNQSPENFIYSSCSVDTLARDLEKLKNTYTIKKIKIFDLFPHTSHFETLVWLLKR